MNRLGLACVGLALTLGPYASMVAAADARQSSDRPARVAVAGDAGRQARFIKVHRGGHRYYPRSSVVISGSLWWPLGYPYYAWPYAYPLAGWPYYGFAPPVTVFESAPEPAITAQPPAPSWYYCPESKAYYPYVTECPRGWENVPATPADKK
jgi:hypothetical protein